MIVTQRISITMDAILSLGGASAVLTGLSPISSSYFSTGDGKETVNVPSGAILAVFYSVAYRGSTNHTYISLSPITVAIPQSGSIWVPATGLQAYEAQWETEYALIASLSSTSLEISKQVTGMVLWLG